MKRVQEKVFMLMVLMALAIIFVPMMWNKNWFGTAHLDYEIPSIPKGVADFSARQHYSTEVALSEKIFFKGLTENMGWVVQLGIFDNPEESAILVEKLKVDGFPAYTHLSFHEAKTLHTVFVGPVVAKSDAQKLLKTVEFKYNLKGMVARYIV